MTARLYTAGIPDPDLLVRTSGELRVSNFLLWQIAYSELWVTPTLWPDFGRADLLRGRRRVPEARPPIRGSIAVAEMRVETPDGIKPQGLWVRLVTAVVYAAVVLGAIWFGAARAARALQSV